MCNCVYLWFRLRRKMKTLHHHAHLHRQVSHFYIKHYHTFCFQLIDFIITQISLSIFLTLRRRIFLKFWTQMHRPSLLMRAALGNPTARQTQARPSSALRKTVQTLISNNNSQSTCRLIQLPFGGNGSCHIGGWRSVWRRRGYTFEKSTVKLFFFFFFYTHWETSGTFNHRLPYNKCKRAFWESFLLTKEKNSFLNCHSNTLSIHFFITKAASPMSTCQGIIITWAYQSAHKHLNHGTCALLETT